MQSTDTAAVGGYSYACKQIRDEFQQSCTSFEDFEPSKKIPSGKPPCDPAIDDLTLFLETFIETYKQFDTKQQAEFAKSSSIDITQVEKDLEELQRPQTRIALNLQKLLNEKPPVNEKCQALINELINSDKTSASIKTMTKLFSELLFHIRSQSQKWLEQQFAYFIDEVIKEEKEKFRSYLNKAMIVPHYHKLKQTIANKRWGKDIKQKCTKLAERLKNAVNLDDYFNFFKETKELPTEVQHAINSSVEELSPWLSGSNGTGLHYIPAQNKESYPQTASRYHLQIIISTLQLQHDKLTKAKNSPVFLFKSMVDRYVFDFFETGGTADNYELINSLLIDAKTAVDHANEDLEEAQLITFIGKMKTKVIRNKEKMSLNQLLSDELTRELESLITHAGQSFQNYYEIRNNLDELLKKDGHVALSTYQKERLNKPILIKNSLSFRSWRLRMFDRFFPGGKMGNTQSKGKPHDGITHRQNSADRLIKYLNQCDDPESYYNYVGLCCYELSQIQDKNSAFKTVIISLLTKIIDQKILSEASVSQKTFIYRMLTAALKDHPNAKELLNKVKEDLLKNGVPESLIKQIQKDTQAGVKMIEFTNESLKNSPTLPSQDETVTKSPALSRFHNTIFNVLNSRLLAYKIIPSGLFQLSAGSYSEIGSNLSSALGTAASATGLPFIQSAGNIITNVFSDIDQDQRSEAYRNINKLFDTPEKCARFSKFIAETLTQIWEYQVEKVGTDNAKILAQCAVERMIDYLMQGYFVDGVPIETQLIAAVRGQRIGGPIENFRLTNDECATILSRKAWLAHEIFEKTPIYDPDNNDYYYSPEFKSKFGAARDGAVVAELLNIAKAEKPVDNNKYEEYEYQTKAPNYQRAKVALQTGPEKIMGKVKKLKQLVREQHVQLQQRDDTIQKQTQVIEQQNERIDQLSQQMTGLQQAFSQALENQKLLQQQLQELQHSLPARSPSIA